MSKLVINIELPEGATVAVSTEESAAPAKPGKGKTKAAAESAQPAATPAPVATAPAAQPAQSPAAPTISKETLNKAVTKLAGINRDAAIAILAKFGTRTTATLNPDQYQAVFDAFEEEQARFDAAAAQASLV